MGSSGEGAACGSGMSEVVSEGLAINEYIGELRDFDALVAVQLAFEVQARPD